MKEIKYFLAQNLLCLIDSGADCTRGENVRTRRMNMGFDTLLGHKQDMWVV